MLQKEVVLALSDNVIAYREHIIRVQGAIHAFDCNRTVLGAATLIPSDIQASPILGAFSGAWDVVKRALGSEDSRRCKDQSVEAAKKEHVKDGRDENKQIERNE